MDYKGLVSTAIEAGRAILGVYETEFSVASKNDQSPVTEADVLAHEIIHAFLIKSGLPVLSEEGKVPSFEERKEWNKFWVVDPLDGTREFVRRNGEFTVNIALVENRQPVFGLIYAPVLRKLYFTYKKEIRFIGVDDSADPAANFKNAVTLIPDQVSGGISVAASKSHFDSKSEQYLDHLRRSFLVKDIVHAGSSLKFCLIAEGIVSLYPRLTHTMEWDTAAGQAIAEAAGASVISVPGGEKLQYNKENLQNPGFVVVARGLNPSSFLF